jgi:enoyl-CoA hydratase/carnithine racemase
LLSIYVLEVSLKQKYFGLTNSADMNMFLTPANGLIANSMAELVTVEINEQIAILSLNNPAQRNALDEQMRLQITHSLHLLNEDNDCRAIVLTGSNGEFCAGGNLKSDIRSEPPAIRTPRLLHMLHDMIIALAVGKKPVVAAVDGHAYGAGLSLAVACNYIVAGPTAKFCASFGKVGLIPDAGLFWSLPRRIGVVRGQQMILSACSVDVDNAVRIGLVDEKAAAGETIERALIIAKQYAQVAPLVAAHVRDIMHVGFMQMEEAFVAEMRVQPMMTATEDYKEGRAAFAERRKPHFKGR